MLTNGNGQILYPKHVNSYLQCPERYFHERVERRRVEQPPSPALARGIAAHQMLSGLAAEYERSIERNGAAALPIDLRARAETVLPRHPYPSESAWVADIATLVEEVRFGISYLDGAARVLATEATHQYRYAKADGCPPFVLVAKTDLVLLRQDADGRSYLDVVDWKGGASLKPDAVQEIAGRIVIKQNAPRLFGVAFDYVQTTTVYLGAKVVRSEMIDDAECGRRWGLVKRVAAAIIEGTDWRPTPSPLCEWCPWFGHVCSLAPDGQGSDDSDDLGAWLDGVVDQTQSWRLGAV